MAKRLEFQNSSILEDCIEIGTIRVASVAGSSVSVTLDNNNGLAQNDYVLFEEMGTGRAEIAKINAAVSAGTAIQVDTLLFPHNVGVKVYRLAYNQVKFYHADTLTGVKTLLGSAVAIDADDEFTVYIDSVNSTGYGFFALFNSTTSAESDTSSGFSYSSAPLTMKSEIRSLVKKFYKKDLDEETFSYLVNSAEDEIYSIRLWNFREKTTTFSTAIGTQKYLFSSISLIDFYTLLYATYDSLYPLTSINVKEFRELNEGGYSSSSSTPSKIFTYGEAFYLTPTPSAVGTVEILYYKKSIGFTEETTESDVSMPQAIAFRVLQDLWSMDDTKKSEYWERRYLQVIASMKSRDKKQVNRFAPLSHSRATGSQLRNPFEYPSISV